MMSVMATSFNWSMACAAVVVVAVGGFGVADCCCIATENACAAGVMDAEVWSWTLASCAFNEDMVNGVGSGAECCAYSNPGLLVCLPSRAGLEVMEARRLVTR